MKLCEQPAILELATHYTYRKWRHTQAFLATDVTSYHDEKWESFIALIVKNYFSFHFNNI